ncbi:hypothetical protein MPTK1_3g01620 [Marchantia polymorpha subsp. ruderalis]|uniref:Uncharacterized protein n=2 Tax=Marchantia polymorpha TaxID=3197 RepID=A0AAF6AWD5_MARPO|nr:hypothetical protein MARPO_0007s0154 [Marchantia polymorpha]BBN04069.1 hypothetical protein Mp_3g01620 [Marchantia polymorpha subsp. ruderalis]|eukprot:PTQ47756.1 hypothetical protein MARPO_0007s0154 [Marchantia polymorpha]
MSSDSEAAAFAAPFKPPPFVEVWTPDGTVRRFASGTKAKFAIDRINNRIEDSNVRVDTIESVKEGEESVEFGPDSELVSYGKDWKLNAVCHSCSAEAFRVSSEQESNGGPPANEARKRKKPKAQETQKLFNAADFYPGGVLPQCSPPQNTCVYISNVLIVFGVLFALAGSWVYFLESKFFVIK